MNDTPMKRARLARGMTLKELADNTGLSQAFLSEVENGKANPTLESLRRIARGLGVSLFDIIGQDRVVYRVVRAKERRTFRSAEYNIEYELVSDLLPEAKSEVVTCWLEPGGCTADQPQSHGLQCGAEEIGIVMCGTIEVHLGDTVEVLYQGDSIRFDPAIPHRYVNPGPTRANLLAIMTPPSY